MNSNDSWQSIIKDLESIEKESSEYFEIVRSRVFPKLLGFLKDDNNQKIPIPIGPMMPVPVTLPKINANYIGVNLYERSYNLF